MAKREVHPTRAQNDVKRKKLRRGCAGAMRVKQDITKRDDNPFSRVSCAPKRRVVLGRRFKGANRDVSKTLQNAITTRKSALLYELRNTSENKHSSFVDRRFGISDHSLNENEKSSLRFEAHRSRLSKASRFQLADEPSYNEDEEGLTHYGSQLSDLLKDQPTLDEQKREREFFEHADDDEDDDGFTEMNFGGGDDKQQQIVDTDQHISLGSGDGSRTKLEIMKEVMAKSKAWKATNAMQKDEDMKLLNDVDDAWSNIRQLMSYRDIDGDDKQDQSTERTNDFDMFARELSMAKREIATNRIKTDEEIAREVYDKLAEYEATRLERMSHSSKAASSSCDVTETRVTAITEDEDEIQIDPEFIIASSEDEDEDEDEHNEVTHNNRAGNHSLINSVTTATSNADITELAFTFTVPQDVKEFSSWVLNRSASDFANVIQRVIACNHRSLDMHNSAKLQRFTVILVQYFGELCYSAPNSMVFLNILSGSIFQLAQQFPQLIGNLSRQRLVSLRRCIATRLRSARHSHYPKPRHLLELQLFSSIFSVTDFQHSFVTPALCLIGQALLQLPLKGVHDIVPALFMAGITLQCTTGALRYVPELVSFAHSLLLEGVEPRLSTHNTSVSAARGLWLPLLNNNNNNNKFDDENCSLIPLAALWYQHDNPYFSSKSFLHASLSAVLSLLGSLTHIYKASASFIEIFSPVAITLNLPVLSSYQTCTSLRIKLQDLLSSSRTNRCALSQLAPLHCIRSFEPQIDESFTAGPSKDSRRVMQRQMKSAKRCAKRELRRDADFIETERRAVLDRKKAEHDANQLRIRTFIEEQQRDTNIFNKFKRKAS